MKFYSNDNNNSLSAFCRKYFILLSKLCIYFNINPKLTFETNIGFKQRENVRVSKNSLYKNYLAPTQAFNDQICSFIII